MANYQKEPKIKKNYVALLAALAMTIFMGFLILAVGANSLIFNKVEPAQASGQADQISSADQATIQQLQDLVSQYQTREAQYKSELQQASDNLSQVNQQLQQYQQLTQALVDAGVIQITANGQVMLGPSVRSGTGSGEGD